MKDNRQELKPLYNEKKYQFNRSQLKNLSSDDQILFEQFGQGSFRELPYHCIHHAFEAQAMAQPEAIAAEHQGESITYQQLNQQANYLAMKLRQAGVSSGDHVALFLKRSIPMLVGMLATLKVGAAYVPQHVGVAPKDQLEHIIHAAETRVILTLSELQEQVPVPEGHQCFAIDEVMQEANAIWPLNVTTLTPRQDHSPGQTCFILFTSGTTGKPNGVQVTHQNVCNILLTTPGNLGIRPGMKVGQILSIAFDMSAWEVWACLAHGGTLLIRGKNIQETVSKADVVISTPSILSGLDSDLCQNIKVAAVAGEPCPRPLADKWGSFCDFYNSCGPTETTIINTAQLHRPENPRLTIGAPTPNNTVYVLDENLQPCAMGEAGEMWAGGDCVTAGYLHNEALNGDRYRDDPFLGNGRKMFRTRDLGRWTADGQLEHLGRTDDQVKIRGFRVELDSVSTVLERTEGCRQAVTLKLNNRYLAAFVAPANVDTEQALENVRASLPYYCEPAVIVAMDELPMTPRGKLDKRQLLATAETMFKQQEKK